MHINNYGVSGQLWENIKIKCNIITIGVIYRPPHTNVNVFINEFEDTLRLIYPTVKYYAVGILI